MAELAHLNIHTTLIEECAYFTLAEINVNFFGDFETTLYVHMLCMHNVHVQIYMCV